MAAERWRGLLASEMQATALPGATTMESGLLKDAARPLARLSTQLTQLKRTGLPRHRAAAAAAGNS